MEIDINNTWYNVYVGQDIDVFKNDCLAMDAHAKIYTVTPEQKGHFIMTRNLDLHRYVVYVDASGMIEEVRCG